MRKMKKTMIPALGLALLIVVSVFLPAGAATTTAPKGDAKSQEFVLCETDASGVIEKVRVFDMLSVAEQSGSGSFDFKMTNEFAGSDPSKITGVNSFKKPELDGDYIIWKDVDAGTNSNIIADTQFSKSMVTEAKSRIPLDVEYKYYFNGQMVSGPKAIEGKEGHFRLEATFVNTSAEKMPVKYKNPDTGETVVAKTDVYLPLVIQPYDWKWDNQHFFNVETDPTCVTIFKPDVYQTGWTVPLFPPATDEEYTIWVEADVKDFSMPALTLVVAFVFPETNQTDALEQLGPGIATLYDGVKQLDSGLTEAVAGLGSATTPDTLIYGISQIYDGLLTLSSNTEGLGYAKSNIDTGLIPGVNQLYGGTDLLLGGLADMKAGIGSATTPDSLLYAVDAVQGGLNGIYGGLSQVITGLSSGVPPGGILQGLQAISAGIGSTSDAYDESLLGGLQYAANNLNPAGGALYNAVDHVYDGLSDSASTLNTNLALVLGTYPALSTDANWLTAMGELQTLAFYLSHTPGTLGPTDAGGALEGLAGLYGALMAPLTNDPPGVIATLQYMKTGVDSMIAGIGGAATPGTLLNGLTMMQLGIGSASTPDTLLYAMAQMQLGLTAMAGGIGDMTTPTSLIGGVTQIKYGLSSGSNANPGVKEGLAQLSGGLGEAISALGSAGTPDTALYGTNLVKEGMVTLQEGLTGATTEGTQMMITAMNGSLVQINLTHGELEAIKERAAEFDAFLGKPVDGESQVRFILQTPATYRYADSTTSGIVALVLSILIGIALVLLGIFAFRKLA